MPVAETIAVGSGVADSAHAVGEELVPGDAVVRSVGQARTGGGMLNFLGEHPAVAVAVFVHLLLLFAFSQVQIEREKEPATETLPVEVSMFSVNVDPLAEEPDQAVEDGGPPVPLPEFMPGTPGVAEDDTAQESASEGGATRPDPPPESTQPAPEGTPPRGQLSESNVLMRNPGDGRPGSERQGVGDARAGGFSNRNAEGRGLGIMQYGGSAQSESAVEAGLHWLQRHLHRTTARAQDRSGIVEVAYWNPLTYPHDARREDGRPMHGGCSCGETAGSLGNAQYTVGATGLAYLAFLGAGYTHQNGGEFQLDLMRVHRWLLQQQGREGRFSQGNLDNLYNHVFAMLSLAEAWTLTRDPGLAQPMQRAVDFLEGSQGSHGGWGYQPLPQNVDTGMEMTITTWAILALRTAEVGGARVRRDTWLKAIHFVERMTHSDDSVYYSDQLPQPQNLGRASMLATGIFLRRLLGQDRDEPVIQREVSLLMRDMPNPNRMTDFSSSYYAIYIGGLATFFVGGDTFSRWNSHTRDMLLRLQHGPGSGHIEGSWPGCDSFSYAGGRFYTTAMSLLALEVYYRYVPGAFLAGTDDLQRFWTDRDARYMVIGQHLRRTARDFLNNGPR